MPSVSKVRARFIGKDSLGYKHFNIYELYVWIENGFIVVERLDHVGRCPYSTIESFVSNWQIVYRSEGNEDAAAE